MGVDVRYNTREPVDKSFCLENYNPIWKVCRGIAVRNPALCFRGTGFVSPSGDYLSSLKLFIDFTLYFQTNSGIGPQITTRPVSSTHFPIHLVLIILLLDAI